MAPGVAIWLRGYHYGGLLRDTYGQEPVTSHSHDAGHHSRRES